MPEGSVGSPKNQPTTSESAIVRCRTIFIAPLFIGTPDLANERTRAGPGVLSKSVKRDSCVLYCYRPRSARRGITLRCVAWRGGAQRREAMQGVAMRIPQNKSVALRSVASRSVALRSAAGRGKLPN